MPITEEAGRILSSGISTMPQSISADSFGYAMQREISGYMRDFYSGKVSEEDVKNYFADCCKVRWRI